MQLTVFEFQQMLYFCSINRKNGRFIFHNENLSQKNELAKKELGEKTCQKTNLSKNELVKNRTCQKKTNLPKKRTCQKKELAKKTNLSKKQNDEKTNLPKATYSTQNIVFMIIEFVLIKGKIFIKMILLLLLTINLQSKYNDL